MNDYLIGAGAILSPAPQASVERATLHAQTDPLLARTVRAAAIDFEGSASGLRRLLLLVSGWNASRFDREVLRRLCARGCADLGEVLAVLGRAAGEPTVHLFARWFPDDAAIRTASARGVAIVNHPLEVLENVALVHGARRVSWPPPAAA